MTSLLLLGNRKSPVRHKCHNEKEQVKFRCRLKIRKIEPCYNTEQYLLTWAWLSKMFCQPSVHMSLYLAIVKEMKKGRLHYKVTKLKAIQSWH